MISLIISIPCKTKIHEIGGGVIVNIFCNHITVMNNISEPYFTNGSLEISFISIKILTQYTL